MLPVTQVALTSQFIAGVDEAAFAAEAVKAA